MKSIITSRRNYVIKVFHEDNDMIHGPMGQFPDSFFQCYLKDLKKYDWYYFSKKKDYDNAVAELKAAGIRDANKAYGWA